VPIDQPYASVQVEGVETVGNVSLVEVEDNDRLIDKATVVFDDVAGVAAATMLEQRKVVIELGWGREKARIFEGLIWRVKSEARGDLPVGLQRVTLIALDLSFKMNQGVGKPRVHPAGKLSDIVSAIVAPYAIPVGQIKLDPDPQFTDDAPLVQGPRTDWAFLQELAIRYSARTFVEVNDDQSKFYFVSEKALLDGDGVGGITFVPGSGPLIEFRYERIATAAAPIRSAVVIDPATGDPVVKTGTPPAPEPPLSVDPDEKSELDKLGGGEGTVYSNAVDVMSKAAGKVEDARAQETIAGAPSDPNLADQLIQQDPTRQYGLLGRGIAVGSVNLRAKTKITIKGVAPWAEGDWYVRRVHHRVTSGSGLDEYRQPLGTYRTRFVVTR